MSEITPATVWTGFWRWFGIGVAGLLLLGALILIGWQAGWWFTTQNTSRTAKLIQNSQFSQSSLKTQFDGDMKALADIQAQQGQGGAIPSWLTAQAVHAGQDACSAADQITNGSLSPTDLQWVRAHCSGPAMTAAAIRHIKATGE